MARQKVKIEESVPQRPSKSADAAPDSQDGEAAPPLTRRKALAEVRKKLGPARRAARKAKRKASGKKQPRPGRPPFQLDEEMAAQVQAAAAFGCTVDELATLLAIDPTTIFRNKTVFEEALEKGRIISNSRIKRSLFENGVAGSLGHATMWLKVVGGWRETTAAEISGPGGGPIQSQTTLMTDDEISSRLQTLVERSLGVMAHASDVALDDDTPDRVDSTAQGISQPIPEAE